jgi:2-dehydropantoate 2-reductase
MRILVVGAGAIGGYFGGRLLAAGRDVAFLVRERRATQLAQNGLVIRSSRGDLNLAAPPTVTADRLREPFDLILLSCKAYDLADAADSFAPAVGSQTAILPLLNGMAHMDFLATRFGRGAVLGGLCLISTTLDAEGRILHLNEAHLLAFGEQDGLVSARSEAFAAALGGAGFDARLSKAIVQEMWEKWVFIATGAGITCLMRASFGDIVSAGAVNLTTVLFDECCVVAAAHGFAPGESSKQQSRTMFSAPKSTITASMLRDVERGGPIEADHIVGDLLRRGEMRSAGDTPLLRIAYAHLKAYEARRKRENAGSQTPTAAPVAM